MSQYRINEYRIYEGEWYFQCTNKECHGTIVEYSLNEYEDYADKFLKGAYGPIHAYEVCHNCNNPLEWSGYSGNSPISNSLISLLNSGHYMAATVILSAVVENAISNLLWAALVDNGVDKKCANDIASGRISRIDSINMISSLTGIQIKDIVFPSRNLVAHGKGFNKSEQQYKNDLVAQIDKIHAWIKKALGNKELSNFNPSECERWLLFMKHWSSWIVRYVKPKLLCSNNNDNG